MTARTSGSSPRASRARHTPRCSAPLVIKLRGWSCPLMGMRVIGGSCAIFLDAILTSCIHSLARTLTSACTNSFYLPRCRCYAYSARVVIYDPAKDVRFTVTEGWDRSPDSIIVGSSSSTSPSFHPLYFVPLHVPFHSISLTPNSFTSLFSFLPSFCPLHVPFHSTHSLPILLLLSPILLSSR